MAERNEEFGCNSLWISETINILQGGPPSPCQRMMKGSTITSETKGIWDP